MRTCAALQLHHAHSKGRLLILNCLNLPSSRAVHAGDDKVDGMYEVKLADFGLSTKVTAKMQRLKSMRSSEPGLPPMCSAPVTTTAV
jgi:hypothetical protein